jgi:hypothetical protein
MRRQINVYCYAPPPTDSWEGTACNQRDHLRDAGDQDADRLDHHLPQAQQTRLWTVGRLARRLRGVENIALVFDIAEPDDRTRMVLIPFDAREALTLQQAAQIATVSETTIARCCKEPGIGRKIGGGWRVSRVALQMMLDDNGWALVAYLDGDWTSQRVTRYFRDLGLGDILPMSADALASPR